MTKLYFAVLAGFCFFNVTTAQDTSSYIIKKERRMVVNQHQPQYTYTQIPNKYIEDFALGIDYQQESFSKILEFDSAKKNYQNAGGFNLYFMSGLNQRLKLNSGGLLWGGGFSVNFQNDGKRYGIQLTTDTKDSGYTCTENTSAQIYGLSRYEYRMGPFIPFVGIQLGLKWFSSSQYINSYIKLAQYESSSSSEHIRSTGSLYAAPEIGFRLRMGAVGSFVASYSVMMGGDLNLTDIDQSSFTGFKMNMVTRNAKLDMQQFRFGFLFDLSTHHNEKKLVKDAYTDTSWVEEITEVQNRMGQKVNCPCCKNNAPTSTPPVYNNSNIDYQSKPNYYPPVESSPSVSPIKKPSPGIRVNSKPTIKTSSGKD